MGRASWVTGGLLALFLAGCQAKEPGEFAVAASDQVTAYRATPALAIRARPGPASDAGGCVPPVVRHAGPLAGRVLRVGRIEDLNLADGEVVLTFDDGPYPGRTPRILRALRQHGVSATFMMVGTMARSYPELVRLVADEGHTIGSHTNAHADLSRMGKAAALEEVARGERAVAAALSDSGRSMAPFFRFPYLADTPALRAAMARRGTVILDVHVDSKDYWPMSPQRLLARTMARLDRRGKGIVLFHDLHERTVRMLPDFLDALGARGYSVVHLVPANAAACPASGS